MDRIIRDDVAKVFSRHAADYDKWFDDHGGRLLFDSEVRAIRVLMKDMVAPFLEIGVGSGRFAEALGIHYGIDPAEALLEIANKRGIKVKKAVGEKLPFSNGFFGGVFLLFTLCFVKEPRRVIAEARRVLKKDGRMILGIINKDSFWGKFYQKKKAEGHSLYRHARFYSVKDVVGLLEKAGMTIEAFSSTLCQAPSAKPYEEPAYDYLIEDAGFICVRARKANNRRGK